MTKRERLLLIDDDSGFRRAYRTLFEADGFEVLEAGGAADARKAFEGSGARLVVLDLMLPPSGRAEEGAELGASMMRARPEVKVIVVSGAGDTRLALSLVQRGAYDFVAKPVDPDVLLAVVARAHARLALEDRVAELESKLVVAVETGPLGAAPAFLDALTLCERAAPTDVPVLITGPSGTGKEVFARALHARSRRANKPFVAINCGALAASLLESTLFGHRRGAFTGAVADAPGVFVEANGGSLLLDEIGDMDPALQVKLLRVLESGEVLPVGASKPTQVDVRTISATHRPLPEMIAEKAFREDLYWRIRGIEIALPRLADRASDIPMLAQHFLNQARHLVAGSGSVTLAPSALRRLENHAWPGNLRELRHEMQRALVMAAGRREILEDDLSPSLFQRSPPDPAHAEGAGEALEQKIALLEHREIQAALEACGGNRSQAAQRLGISRQGLLNKMDRHGLR